MVRRIYANNQQFRSINELKQAIIRAYDEIADIGIQNLAKSMSAFFE